MCIRDRAIADAVKKAAKANKIKIVIPSGTAIQNARTSFIGDHRDLHYSLHSFPTRRSSDLW